MALSNGPMGQFSVAPAASATVVPRWAAGKGSWRDRSSSPSSSQSFSFSSATSIPWRRLSSTSASSDSEVVQTSSARSSGNWRIGAPPASKRLQGLPSFDDLRVGQVVYLPDRSTIPANSKIWPWIRSDPWHHPAVVTGKWEEEGEQYVHFRQATSFEGRTLEEARPHPNHWKYFFLAENKVDDSPPTGTQLLRTVPGSGCFPKRTYVNYSVGTRYSIEYKYLLPFSGAPLMRFDAESTSHIVAFCHDAAMRDGQF